jgi:ring-1,2-phenylacetyl-CoA epoxidase subunit PaaC
MNGDVAQFALRVGDDALITAQRLAEWSARAPEMEEDVALSNIALDQLGVARFLLTYAGELDGARDEDGLAFQRDDLEFRNCLLVELPNAGPATAAGAPGDFGVTMARLLLLSAYQKLLYDWLVDSADPRISAIAAKARKESAYHLDHAALWTVRLGDGTAESHRRMQAAVDDLWPYTHELFEADPVTERLAAASVVPPSLRPQWLERVSAVLAEATLVRPADGWAPSGGRQGRHTEHLSYLLAEMQVLHRAHPGAQW